MNDPKSSLFDIIKALIDRIDIEKVPPVQRAGVILLLLFAIIIVVGVTNPSVDAQPYLLAGLGVTGGLGALAALETWALRGVALIVVLAMVTTVGYFGPVGDVGPQKFNGDSLIVSGRVVYRKGVLTKSAEPVIGANVTANGARVGAITSDDGRFEFRAPAYVMGKRGTIGLQVNPALTPVTFEARAFNKSQRELPFVLDVPHVRIPVVGPQSRINQARPLNAGIIGIHPREHQQQANPFVRVIVDSVRTLSTGTREPSKWSFHVETPRNHLDISTADYTAQRGRSVQALGLELPPEMTTSDSFVIAIRGSRKGSEAVGSVLIRPRSVLRTGSHHGTVNVSVPRNARAGSFVFFVSALPEGGPHVTQVLWVDDRPADNEAIVSYLRNSQVGVTVTGNTNSALEWLASRPFDVVVSGLARPLLDSMRMRQLRTPVVIYSNAGGEKYLKSSMAMQSSVAVVGAFGVARSPDELIHYIQKAALRAAAR